MKIICPSCEQPHNNRYAEDSDWCTKCTQEYIDKQCEDIDLGQTFG